MGKSGEGRGLFRRRSAPPEQDPSIDLTSVLSAYGRTATVPEPPVTVDDDTVRYTATSTYDDVAQAAEAAEPVPTRVHDLDDVIDVTGTADAEAVVDLTDAPEPVEAPAVDAVPAAAGWWEADAGTWDDPAREEIDAVVHGELAEDGGIGDAAPEVLDPEEAYGHHEEHAPDAGPLEVAAWATVLDSAADSAGGSDLQTHDAVSDEPEQPVASDDRPWWQALQTDDLGGVPSLGTEQHDEQHAAAHAHHEEHAHDDVHVDLSDRLPEEPSDERPWWQALQSADHDVAGEHPVVDVREESLSDDPEAVAARLARLRDAGLLSDDEYVAETQGLLADRG